MPGPTATPGPGDRAPAARDAAERERPVKLVLQRRARPGCRQEFEDWIARLVKHAGRSAALQGSSVLHAGGDEYFILLRFASQAELDRWEASPEAASLMHAAEALATATDEPVRRSGLETWFTLPGHAVAPAPPPRWKMALVTWLALLPQVILLALVLPKGLPFLASVALSTAIPVCMLTWVLMPRLTKLLERWLYAPRSSG